MVNRTLLDLNTSNSVKTVNSKRHKTLYKAQKLLTRIIIIIILIIIILIIINTVSYTHLTLPTKLEV